MRAVTRSAASLPTLLLAAMIDERSYP